MKLQISIVAMIMGLSQITMAAPSILGNWAVQGTACASGAPIKGDSHAKTSMLMSFTETAMTVHATISLTSPNTPYSCQINFSSDYAISGDMLAISNSKIISSTCNGSTPRDSSLKISLTESTLQIYRIVDSANEPCAQGDTAISTFIRQ